MERRLHMCVLCEYDHFCYQSPPRCSGWGAATLYRKEVGILFSGVRSGSLSWEKFVAYPVCMPSMVSNVLVFFFQWFQEKILFFPNALHISLSYYRAEIISDK